MNDEVERLSEENEIKIKHTSKIRRRLVLLVLVVTAVLMFVSNRATYLKIKSIGEGYTSIFFKNFYLKAGMFLVSFFVTYLTFFINNKMIKRGMKQLFDKENRKMPKLPNKSLSLVFGLLAGVFSLNFLYTKFITCINMTLFGETDPIFGFDIGVYMFVFPFLKAILIYLVVFTLIMVAYTAIYYVVAINVCFENGIDMQDLKKNTFIKQIKFWVILFAIAICGYILVCAQDIFLGEMISIKDTSSTSLTGAGLADISVKLWGYRIFAIVVLISIINIVKNASVEKFRKCIASASIIPLYLVLMFGALIYFQEFYVGSSELDKEKEYIKYNIDATKEAYGIDISTTTISDYDTISASTVKENSDVVTNIPIINESVINQTVTDTQDNSTYYKYSRSNLGVYNTKNGVKRLIALTAREIIDDSNRSYNNKTFEYTHGYSVVVTDPTTVDKNGYVTMLQTDFSKRSSDILQVEEPRIYFGLETDSEIIVNSKYGEEFDYPITTTESKTYSYDGDAGLSLGLLDRIVVGLDTGNYKLILSKYLDEDSKIITTRNILERCKTLLPYIDYDENPYMVLTDEGNLVWVIDGYTVSCNYPYSQVTTITKSNGMKEKINYIRNSVKVLIDSYTGETKFYITDRDDPIIMMYRNLYPDLFVDLDESIPESIQVNLQYSQYLFDIQANVISTYHDISEDTLYRADDVWSLATDGETVIPSTYTMLKTNSMRESELGLVTTYTKQGKESITSYLVGTYESGKQVLSLYKFASESSIIGVSQMNSLIEEDGTISSALEALKVSGVKIKTDVIIVPIENTLLYVEPVYQVRLNELETQVLKKVIVASGNKVAIGDSLEIAIENLLSDSNSVKLEYVDMEDIEQVIDSIIEANSNLQESIDSGNLEMIGKDITTLQTLIDQLEVLRNQEIEESGGNKNEFTK
jgi:hypothetical protein